MCCGDDSNRWRGRRCVCVFRLCVSIVQVWRSKFSIILPKTDSSYACLCVVLIRTQNSFRA